MIENSTLKNILPYLTGALITFGVAKQVFFYNHFDINIIQYLDLSESIILFFEDILTYLFYILVFFILFAITGPSISQENAVDTARIVSQDNWFKRQWVFMKTYGFVMILWGSTLFFQNQSSFSISTWGIFLVFWVLMETKYYYKNSYNLDIKATTMNLLLFGALCASHTYTDTRKDAEAIKNHKFIGTTITTNKGEINSDSTLVFVGKTKNYAFLYSKESNISKIIPCSEILEINLQQK